MVLKNCKSTRVDGVNVKLLKAGAIALRLHQSYILNCSLIAGEVLDLATTKDLRGTIYDQSENSLLKKGDKLGPFQNSTLIKLFYLCLLSIFIVNSGSYNSYESFLL